MFLHHKPARAHLGALALLLTGLSSSCGARIQGADEPTSSTEASAGGRDGESSTEAGASDPGSTGGGPGPVPGGGQDAGSLLPVTVGEVDPNAPPDSGLPPLPRLTSVRAGAVGDSVSISFDPVEGAVDYRVYELPSPDVISTGSDGSISVEGAVFRCAGQRQAPRVPMDAEPQLPSGALRTLVDNQDVKGYTRTLAEATLGYVFQEPGDGRVPVYALGESDPSADNPCYFHRYTASRRKQYVTSDAERQRLLAEGYRDDGVVFYVPSSTDGRTRPVYTAVDPASDDFGGRYYYVDGPEAARRNRQGTAFAAFTTQVEGSVPLMRVHYQGVCSKPHDELVAGKPRFDLVRAQGDGFPVTRLHWSGLSSPNTILVVEALDRGCPYQGLLSPEARPGASPYAPWITFDEAQAAHPHRELYINGQFDGTTPRPIARSFVRIGPAAAPELDWSFGFRASDSLGTVRSATVPAVNCAEVSGAESPEATMQFYCPQRYAQGPKFGEWWTLLADAAADTNGKYRLTPKTMGEMQSDSYLYVTMSVDSFSTARRYPQILISDRTSPVQTQLPEGRTLVLQMINDWPYSYELQICDHKYWDVNDQCPRFDFYAQRDPNDRNRTVKLAPNVEVGEQIGMDFPNRWEIYASTERAYVFLDGQPYGCANLPDAGVPSGAVTVTFGHVLYHSGVDHLFGFTGRRLQLDQPRHFDNLGFKSGVAAPVWDETRFPCTSHLLPI